MLDASRFIGDGVGAKIGYTTDRIITTVNEYNNSGSSTNMYTLNMTNYKEVFIVMSQSSTGAIERTLRLDGTSVLVGSETSPTTIWKKITNNGNGTCTVYNSVGTVFKTTASLSIVFNRDSFSITGLHILNNR